TGPPEAKARIVRGMPEHHDEGASLLPADRQPGAGQRRADTPALLLGNHREGGQPETLPAIWKRNDRHRTEHDVADDTAFYLGNQRHASLSGGTQLIHQVGLGVGGERGAMDGADRSSVLGALGSYRAAAHPLTSRPGGPASPARRSGRTASGSSRPVRD